MTKIYIEDLVGMPEERVYQQLKAHERGFFAIMIPKENTLHYGGVAGIYQDYQLARYLGLCLFRISNMVGFTIPALCERGEFTIVTSTRHFRELAGILCFFASGYVWRYIGNGRSSLLFISTITDSSSWCRLCFSQSNWQFISNQSIPIFLSALRSYSYLFWIFLKSAVPASGFFRFAPRRLCIPEFLIRDRAPGSSID